MRGFIRNRMILVLSEAAFKYKNNCTRNIMKFGQVENEGSTQQFDHHSIYTPRHYNTTEQCVSCECWMHDVIVHVQARYLVIWWFY